MKANLAEYAFKNLLKPGEHYTAVDDNEPIPLSKKQVKWAYFFNKGDKIMAMFTITTDKDVYAFQSDGEKVVLIPTDLVMSMYTFK